MMCKYKVNEGTQWTGDIIFTEIKDVDPLPQYSFVSPVGNTSPDDINVHSSLANLPGSDNLSSSQNCLEQVVFQQSIKLEYVKTPACVQGVFINSSTLSQGQGFSHYLSNSSAMGHTIQHLEDHLTHN